MISASPSIRSDFDSGLDLEFCKNPMGFRYGTGVFGPPPEYRSLDAIRASLREPHCTGPESVYAIATRSQPRPCPHHRSSLRMVNAGAV